MRVGRSFGQGLAELVGSRNHKDIARRALGADATEKQLKSFANYLSRIMGDGVRSVGLEKLRDIARGLDIESMAELFRKIESEQSEQSHPGNKSTSVELPLAGSFVKRVNMQEGSELDVHSSVREADSAFLRSIGEAFIYAAAQTERATRPRGETDPAQARAPGNGKRTRKTR